MRFIIFCFCLGWLGPTSAISSFASEPKAFTWQQTPVDARALRYQGRIDFTDPSAPVLVWQGSTVTFATDARQIMLGFDQLKGQVFIDVSTEQETQTFEVEDGWQVVDLPAADSLRTVTVFKRTEAAAGTVAFTGVKAPTGAQLHPVATDHNKLNLMFYGDSITVGACNEDGAVDQWHTVATHNTAKSYAALTARQLDAELRTVAVSGVGVVTGYKPYTMEQIWDKLYPAPSSRKAELSWQPDWVFVNLGENDDSFTRNNNQPFPPQFTQEYVELVRAIRQAYPHTRIVLLRGGMYGGARSERLINSWQKAVAQLQNSDDNIEQYVFEHYSRLHPRVEDHQMMAAELIQWMQAKMAERTQGIGR